MWVTAGREARRDRLRVRLIHGLGVAAVIAASALRAGALTPTYGPWGVDLAAIDTSVRPANDFFAYANGTWLRRTPIPLDKPSVGLAVTMTARTEDRLHLLLDEASRAAPAASPTMSVELGAFYASFMDAGRVEQLGRRPIDPALQAIAGAPDRARLGELMGRNPFDFDGSLFAVNIYADRRDPTRYRVNVAQSALAMPDRDYYLLPAFAAKKAAFREYVETLLRLVGNDTPADAAGAVVDFETRLAEASWSRVAKRDLAATYNPMTVAELSGSAPGFPWRAFLGAADLAGTTDLVVAEKGALPKLAAAFAAAPLPTLKAWMAFRLADNAAPYLSSPFADAWFRFHSATLQGQPMQPPRWQRAVRAVSGGHFGSAERIDRFGNMAWGVGELYAARYFPAATRLQVEALVGEVQAAFRARLSSLDWMSPDTRREALHKLDTYTIKVGYPDHARDYSRLGIRRDDLVGNVRRAAQAEWHYQTARRNGPVDRSEWLLTPQTVDAYNGPFRDIVFPAAVLQPPMFDAAADPAVNYGTAGASIAHELTHGFDDQGRKIDAAGALRDWWQPADAQAFRARADQLVRQFSSFEALPGVKVNGELTLGENIADLGGLAVALDAYHASLHGRAAPVIDGMTGDQRVFLGWAQLWRGKLRDDALRQKLASDPHAPREFRVNGVVRNLDSFAHAYEVEPGDGMYLAPGQRVRIW